MPIDVRLSITKNAIGAKLEGGEFEFTLYDELEAKVDDAKNDGSGLITFLLNFDEPGEYRYTLEETDAPVGWIKDDTIYPVEIEIIEDGDELIASVSYPEGHPGFVNTLEADPCSLIVFPELLFDTAGVYEYTLKEISPSGGGWVTDSTVYGVVVTVEDDGYGNLIATIDYPDGFPEFRNTYVLTPVKVVISALKFAVGKELTCGMFQFGLFDQEDNLIATAHNGAAEEIESHG